jgi:hypothetical protein
LIIIHLNSEEIYEELTYTHNVRTNTKELERFMDSIRNDHGINKIKSTSAIRYEITMEDISMDNDETINILDTESLLFLDHKKNAQDFIDETFENWS